MKYKNYKELAGAFMSGELKEWKLVLDNDVCFLSFTGPVPEGVGEDDFYEKKYEEGYELFHGNGYSDLERAIEALGIPCEWC